MRASRLAPVLIVVLGVALPCSEVAAKHKKHHDALLIPSGYPEITPEQTALKSVPFAPGAPAAVLVDAEMQTQEANIENQQTVQIEKFRRVKILTQAGVDNDADFSMTLFGDWRVDKVEARTVLPDGTVVDAKDTIYRESSARPVGDESAIRTIRVAYPKVQVGAILDFRASLVEDGIVSSRWIIQGRLPTIESRFVVVLPPGLRIRATSFLLSPEEAKPVTGRIARGTYYGWLFKNVPAIPDEPFQPPLSEMSKALNVYPESYRSEDVYVGFSPDWKTWGKHSHEAWDDFVRRKHSEVAEVAKAACEGKTTVADKAEAIRRAIRSRFRVDWDFYYPPDELTPDDVLAKGSGDSADAAALAFAMLKSVGIDAVPLVYRLRSDGALPTGPPIPNLLDDVLLRIPVGKDFVYLSLSEDEPVGPPPPEARGVLAMVVDGKAEQPEALPDYTADENHALRAVTAKLGADGSVTGTITATYTGVWADRWRRRLRGVSDDERKIRVAKRFRRFASGLTLESLEISGLEEPEKDLVLKGAFHVDGYATLAGHRLIVNGNLLARERLADWAGTERKTPFDFGGAYKTVDTVVLTLPDETTGVVVPTPPVNYNAGKVGSFRESYEQQGHAVILTRTMRLDLYRFIAAAEKGLKNYLGDVAKMDDRPVVVTLK